MKKLLTITAIAALFCSASAFAALSWSYGWEDGTGTNIGSYTYSPAVILTENSTEQAYEGTHSLKMVEDPKNSTPQVYVWWVNGLQNGDVVHASFWVYSENGPTEYPKGRIYAHRTRNNDIKAYGGSLGGMSGYAGATNWDQASYTWTFDGDGTVTNGLVVEARIYSSSDPGLNTLYIDSTAITVSNNNATIMNAAYQVIPEPFLFSGLLLGLGALFLRKK